MNDMGKVGEYVLRMIETPKCASEISAEANFKVDTARRHLQRLYDAGKAERRRVQKGLPTYYYVAKENADLLESIEQKVAERMVSAKVEEVRPISPSGPPDLTGRMCAMGVWL